MSPSLIYTAGVAVNHLSQDDDDDNDICPVCDGDCTCSKPPPTPTPITSSGAANTRYATLTPASNNSIFVVPAIQPLKIKLTIPKPSIVGHGQQSAQGPSAPKRRGRPPKASRDSYRAVGADRQDGGHEGTAFPKSQSHSQSQHSHAHRLNGSGPRKSSGKPQIKPKASRQHSKPNLKGKIVKKGPTSKKRSIISSGDSDLDHEYNHAFDDVDDDDAASGQFPTFVSASAMSITTSSSDSDTSSSDLDTDSSMEAEEESYILTEEMRQNRARVRRELLGDESHKRKDPHNNWVIRPRKRSVGLSDADMETESDEGTEGDEGAEEDEEEEGDDEDEDEDADGRSSSAAYAGVATGWSDDDESSFDADIFFANLSDSGSDDDTTTSDGLAFSPDAILDDSVVSNPAVNIRRSMDFQVTEGWDGQIVFTNGLSDGQGMVDMEFEASAAQLVAEDSAATSHDSDVNMHSTEEEEEYGDYDEAECELGESDGESTEEELVDENGLPTSRAMTLFRWPTSVSAINPLSTVSPTVSPSPHDRRSFSYSMQDIRDSPRPADILAGKVFWDESDEFDHADGRLGPSFRNGSVTISTKGGVPIMGQFSTQGNNSQKAAILTGANKDVPSPFPRQKRRMRSTSTGSFSSMDFRGRAPTRPSSLSLSISTSSPFPPSSEEPMSQTSPESHPAELYDLDDVLDSSFLDTEPSDGHFLSGTASEIESHRHLQNLSRWDRIPMGTFRRTRETTSSAAGEATGSSTWPKTPKGTASDALAYSNMMKSSPLSTMLWHDKGSNTKGSRRRSKSNMNVIISPVLLPLRDGDRTPTLGLLDPPIHHNNHHQKSRKELRREMKMKRKSCGPVHHHYRHHQHHHHSHHPNMKSRGTASMQRTNFFSSASSVPPLNI